MNVERLQDLRDVGQAMLKNGDFDLNHDDKCLAGRYRQSGAHPGRFGLPQYLGIPCSVADTLFDAMPHGRDYIFKRFAQRRELKRRLRVIDDLIAEATP